MIDESFEITVSASPESAVRAIANFDHLQSWDDTAVEVERLTSGAFSVGTKWRVTVKVGPMPMTMDYEVTTLEPGLAVLRGIRGSTVLTDTISAVERSPGSVLTYRVQIEVGGFARVFEPVLRRIMRPAFKRAAAAIPAAVVAHA